MILKLHRRAEAEIREAAKWYHAQREGLDRRFLQAVRDSLAALESNALRFPMLETSTRQTSFRRRLIEGFPYLIVYEVFENEVFVFAVPHVSRLPNYWRRRKRETT